MVLANWTIVSGTATVNTDPASGTPSTEPALQIAGSGAGATQRAFLTYNTAQQHTHGRITSYLRCQDASEDERWRLYFNYADATHYYVVIIFSSLTKDGEVELWGADGGAEAQIGTDFGTLPAGQRLSAAWTSNYRATWWRAGGVLYVRFEYWNGTAWVQLGVDKTDATPLTPAVTDKFGVEFSNDGSAVAKWGKADKTILEYKN